MSIEVGFSYHRNNVISWLIRKVTGASVSHAFFYDEEGYRGVPMIIEATAVGLHMTPLARFEKHSVIVKLISPEPPIDQALPHVLEQLGAPYDTASLLLAAILVPLRKLKLKIWSPLHSPDAMMCTEVVVRCLQRQFHPAAADLDPEATTPAELMLRLSAYGRTTIPPPRSSGDITPTSP